MILVALALVVVGVLLASGTLQVAPTAGTVRLADRSATSSWSSTGYEAASWSPSQDGRFAGFSVRIRDAAGGGGSPRSVGVVVSCGDVDLWNAGASAFVDGTGTWITITSAALIAKQGRNVTAGQSCVIEVFFDGSLVQVATSASPAFVVWGFPLAVAGSDPGGRGGDGDTPQVDEDDDEPPPPVDGGLDAAVLVAAFVAVAIVAVAGWAMRR